MITNKTRLLLVPKTLLNHFNTPLASVPPNSILILMRRTKGIAWRFKTGCQQWILKNNSKCKKLTSQPKKLELLNLHSLIPLPQSLNHKKNRRTNFNSSQTRPQSGQGNKTVKMRRWGSQKIQGTIPQPFMCLTRPGANSQPPWNSFGG